MTEFSALTTVAAHGMQAISGQVGAMDAEEFEVLLYEARSHKLVGLLDQCVADGSMVSGAERAARIGELAVDVAGWCVTVERHLLQVHDLLLGHDLPHRFVKGSTVAQRYYPHPALRTFVDIDVLVPGDQMDEVVALLVAQDHVRDQPDPYRGFSRTWAKSVTVRSEAGIEVDLHRVLVDGPFGMRAPADAVWSRPAAAVAIGGVDVPALDDVAAFVHACTNAVASYDRVALGSLRDVAQIGEAVSGRASEAAELSERLGVQACVTEAIAQTTRTLGWVPTPDIAELASRPVSRLEQQWIDSYRERPSDLRRALLGVRAIPGFDRKVAYLVSVAGLLHGRPARRRARQGAS